MQEPSRVEKQSFEIMEEDSQALARLGYKQEFKREFNSLSLFCFAFSMMGVLASVSASINFPLSHGGPVSVIWGWLVASTFVITGLYTCTHTRAKMKEKKESAADARTESF